MGWGLGNLGSSSVELSWGWPGMLEIQACKALTSIYSYGSGSSMGGWESHVLGGPLEFCVNLPSLKLTARTWPLEKEIPIGNHHLLGAMLVSGRLLGSKFLPLRFPAFSRSFRRTRSSRDVGDLVSTDLLRSLGSSKNDSGKRDGTTTTMQWSLNDVWPFDKKWWLQILYLFFFNLNHFSVQSFATKNMSPPKVVGKILLSLSVGKIMETRSLKGNLIFGGLLLQDIFAIFSCFFKPVLA